MKTRTKEEIKKQIDGLKAMKQSGRYNFSTMEEIDAQLDVLEGIKEPDDFYQDESAEEFEDGDNQVYFAAAIAEQWLDGKSDEDLFETH